MVADEAGFARRGPHIAGMGANHRRVLRVVDGDDLLRRLGDLRLVLGLRLCLRLRGRLLLRLLVRSECRATVGSIGNSDHQNVNVGKAGRKRHMGVRPQTRGTAMNPVDHPHGGGEGSTTAGRHPVTPWGVPTLGYRTRKKHKASDSEIIRGRRRGKGTR